MEQTNLTRRSFVAGVAGSTGVVLASMAAHDALAAGAASDPNGQAPTGELPWLGAEPEISDADVEQEVSVDVVVIGCGLAGTLAVRSAAEEGATVAAFEKGDGVQARSGEYAIVGGTLAGRWGREEFDIDMLVEHEMDECSYFPKRTIWRKYFEHGAEVFDWYIGAKEDIVILDTSDQEAPADAEAVVRPFFVPMINDYDWTTEQHPCFPSSLIIEPSHVPVIQANMNKAIEAGAQTFYGHFVEKLIMEDGRCTGCYARNAETGKYVKATASKGVILATGDYGSNPDIIQYYCPEVIANGITELWMNQDVEGNPTNTGDGLKLGAWAGAAIQQHHAPMIHHMGNTPDGAQGPLGIDPYLRLNKAGQRFMNEDCPGQQTENQMENQQDHTAYMIWDANWQEQIKSFPAAHGLKYDATQETIDAAVEAGQVYKADTLEELFGLVDIDAEAALASVERYNELAAKGKDEDFGKKASRLFALDTPPYYIQPMGLSPMLVCIGGLESDEECHVYSSDRTVIPGLYACGNIQGNRFAVQYPIGFKGVSHGLCMYYGYVAGKNAVAQK
ncbi:MAG: FAD-binding protein [Coriobacteriia bacterium]|nr:FAD-binding protein [Coriobacteriia bacterium]MBS5477484.1 FAD-binding protein [Coriobacteriia bacterium]